MGTLSLVGRRDDPLSGWNRAFEAPGIPSDEPCLPHRHDLMGTAIAQRQERQIVQYPSNLRDLLVVIRASAASAYASDEQGVRHAAVDDQENVGRDEAQFMLAVCAASCSYLLGKERHTVEADGHRAGKSP